MDGLPLRTSNAHLLPVRSKGLPAILKLAFDPNEVRGADLMAFWGGDSAARVIAHHGNALLLERATGLRSLAEISWNGQDDEAICTICAVAARLHTPRYQERPVLPTLGRWFQDLEPAAKASGGILTRSLSALHELMSDEREITVLHGDLHHYNVLDFGSERGWLAIDPKGIVGERGFDYAIMFLNPDLAATSHPIAVDRSCFLRRLDLVAEAADLERHRLLRWILAWCGLSCVWSSHDDDAAAVAIEVARFAAAELDL